MAGDNLPSRHAIDPGHPAISRHLQLAAQKKCLPTNQVDKHRVSSWATPVTGRSADQQQVVNQRSFAASSASALTFTL